jgi:hypothetical protein
MATLTAIQKAQFIAKSGFCKIESRDRNGMVKTVLVPGSDAKTYRVIIRRFQGHVTTECQLVTAVGEINCKGNHTSVCYHSLAAIAVAAHDAKKTVGFHSNEINSRKAGGKVFSLISHQSGKVMWINLK